MIEKEAEASCVGEAAVCLHHFNCRGATPEGLERAERPCATLSNGCKARRALLLTYHRHAVAMVGRAIRSGESCDEEEIDRKSDSERVVQALQGQSWDGLILSHDTICCSSWASCGTD